MPPVFLGGDNCLHNLQRPASLTPLAETVPAATPPEQPALKKAKSEVTLTFPAPTPSTTFFPRESDAAGQSTAEAPAAGMHDGKGEAGKDIDALSTVDAASEANTALPSTSLDISRASPDHVAALMQMLSQLQAGNNNAEPPSSSKLAQTSDVAPGLPAPPAAAPAALPMPAPATPPSSLALPAGAPVAGMERINSSSHAAEYKRFKNFCERNEMATQVRAAWQSGSYRSRFLL